MSPADHQPYRASDLQALCAVCGEVAEGGCHRCGATLCESHTLAPGMRCPSCEDHFHHLAHDRRVHPLRPYQVWLCYLAGILFLYLGLRLTSALVPEGWDRSIALGGVALLAGMFPLFAIIYRRRRLRPKFLAERPERRRLRMPPPKPVRERQRRPADEQAVGAFVLSLVFFLPFAPLVGGLLGLAVIATRHCRRQRHMRLAIAAAPLGLIITALQILAGVAMVAG